MSSSIFPFRLIRLFPLFLLGLFLLLQACGGSRAISYADSREEIKALMTGFFISESQAEQNSQHTPIHLHIVPVWPERSGQWFYVEQAEADRADEPHRQRMYRIVQLSSERFKILHYEFRNPQVFAGKWKDPSFFEDYPEEIVMIKEGCGVYLHRKAFKHYEGETYGEDCFSQFQGAAYATSVVDVRNDVIKMWNRGYSEEGVQVWGSDEGPTTFVRMNNEVEVGRP